MTASISDGVFDAALNYIKTNCSALHITNAQAVTYANVATYTVGNKASPSWTGPADDTSGRKVTCSAITDGSVTATDTATHIALVYASNSELLVAKALASSQAVTSGNSFTLTAFKISIPDPTV